MKEKIVILVAEELTEEETINHYRKFEKLIFRQYDKRSNKIG